MSEPRYLPPSVLWASDNLTFTPVGYQGPAQHTWTIACDGFHEFGPCPQADDGE